MLSRLTINSTQTCNLGCKYCYAAGGDYGGPAIHILPEVAISKLQDAARVHSVIKLVQFIGGEPLLNFRAMSAVAHEVDLLVDKGVLKDRPILSAVTNLTVLSGDHLSLFQRHNFYLVVSLDGPENIHDELRPTKQGDGSHRKILDNIELLKDYKVPFDIECTYTYKHVQAGISIIDLLEYFNQMEPEEIDIVPVSTAPNDELGFNQNGNWRTVVDMQIEALNFVLDELQKGNVIPYGLFIETVGQINAPATDHYCPAGVSNLAVASDGDLYQCNMFTNNQAYRASITAKANVITKSDIAECRECWARQWCRSCVGNMEIRSPGDPHPYLQHCETLRGSISTVLHRLPNVLDNLPRVKESLR
jgi:uncharacterized protein